MKKMIPKSLLLPPQLNDEELFLSNKKSDSRQAFFIEIFWLFHKKFVLLSPNIQI